MKNSNFSALEKGFGLVSIERKDDQRGSLCFAEWGDLPFAPQRIFWIFDVKEHQTRGSHAHSECEEVVFAVSGAFDMFVDNGKEQQTFHICNPNTGIYIGKNVWCELRNFEPGTICVVVASVKYMKNGYINDYDEFKKNQMVLEPYTPALAEEWNEFVAESKNATFLLDRNFMDYHSDRFKDCSVVFRERGKITAAFPANFNAETKTVYSHQGLTYGGLLIGKEMTAVRVLEAFKMMSDYYREKYDANRIYYKSIPYIYNRQPSEEDKYALFRMQGVKLVARGVSTAVNLKDPIQYERSRKNALKKAAKNDLKVEMSEAWDEYWAMLYDVLTRRHDVKPVHSAAELELLRSRFPESIKLFAIKGEDGKMIAGTYVFIFDNVIHTQYMTASDEARKVGALDCLVDYLIQFYAPTHEYLDFGISTEQQGHVLNEGLIYQKEGFGGRAICYDQYEILIK